MIIPYDQLQWDGKHAVEGKGGGLLRSLYRVFSCSHTFASVVNVAFLYLFYIFIGIFSLVIYFCVANPNTNYRAGQSWGWK